MTRRRRRDFGFELVFWYRSSIATFSITGILLIMMVGRHSVQIVTRVSNTIVKVLGTPSMWYDEISSMIVSCFLVWIQLYQVPIVHGTITNSRGYLIPVMWIQCTGTPGTRVPNACMWITLQFCSINIIINNNNITYDVIHMM
jgi:hypothetical protein